MPIKFTQTQKNRIKAYAQCMLDLAKENIRKNYTFISKSWNPSMKVDFRGTMSECENRNFLHLSFDKNWLQKDGTWESLEYKHIANKKYIGSFKSDDWRIVIKSLIAHELSHSLQYEINPKFNAHGAYKVTKENYDGLHGKDFQEFYKWIVLNGFKEGYWEKMEGHL